MKAAAFISILAVMLAGCRSAPTVTVVQNGLAKGALKEKTVAVAGLTAADVSVYPGQAQEMRILNDAGMAVQKRLGRSRVLRVEEAWSRTGRPPTKHAPVVPVVIGRQLTGAYVRNAHSHGIDYLLWIDLSGNSVGGGSGQWQSSRTEYPTCTCGKIDDSPCQGKGSSTCSSRCCSSCRKGTTVTENHRSASASRRLGAGYSLLDTSSGRAVWRAEAVHSRAETNFSSSESGVPAAPQAPLPPDEAFIMRRMTKAVMDRLPK